MIDVQNTDEIQQFVLNDKLQPEAVEVPNLTPEQQEQVAAYRAHVEWRNRTQTGYLAALLRKGKPFMGVAKKPRKPTKHQRSIIAARTRSAYLKGLTSA